MKPKPQHSIIRTREDASEMPTITDSRFSLFYENAHKDNNGLYSVIGDNSKNTWMYDVDNNKTDIQHLPAENTIFINANIALTDGSSRRFNTSDKTPRTIPNLYDALSALAAKISDINNQIEQEYSTADNYLYVTKSDGLVTISPGNAEKGLIANNVDNTINSMKITSGNGPTSIVISNEDIQFTINPDGDTVGHTYTLGAIIEAIQELNRRTAFIDSTMTFSEAKHHFDVNDAEVTGAFYQYDADDLPAATNGHYSETLSDNIRSVSNNLPRMKIIMYDPGTDKTVNNTGKNMTFIQETSKLNDYTLLDDPTVISPESVAIRMRGCPYLLE